MSEEIDTAGRKWTPAPGNPPGGPMRTGSITGIMVWPGQKVKWQWTHPMGGQSYVSGYEIVDEVEPEKKSDE